MNAIDKLHLLAELGESHCELNHGPGVDNKDCPAVDYIVLPFGYHDNEVVEVTARELVVPVCSECAEALSGDDWTLLYCFECNSSHWVYRPLAKNNYRHHLLLLRGCPECTNEFGGLYFNDLRGVSGELEFLAGLVDRNAA
ncbi:MAG: hypothetical protein OEV73_09050 [Desulfobulbaceae bacterium]|nr:hypothetical protein [Desulfobulbaceae bacterium]